MMRYWLARGPAPQWTHSFTKSGTPPSETRVARAAVVTFETEVPMRAIASEGTPELCVEPPPPPPRSHHHPGGDLAAICDDPVGRDVHDGRSLERLCTARDGVPEEQRIQQHSRDAAGGMREVELICAAAAYDAAAIDRWRGAQVDPKCLEDRQRVVREKLAAEFVARKGVAIGERYAVAAAGQKRGQRRSGRAAADDGDVYRHKSNPNRNGQARTASRRRALTRAPISRASAIV